MESTLTIVHDGAEARDVMIRLRVERGLQVSRLMAWTILSGACLERLEPLSVERDGASLYELDAGDVELRVSGERGADAWYALAQGRGPIEAIDEEDARRRLMGRHPLQFGDLRAAIVSAMVCTDPEAARSLWSRCWHALAWWPEDHPQRLIAASYLSDHLERWLEREPMVALLGTASQRQWAKRIRLRVLQRVGLEQRDRHEAIDRLECQLAKLVTRTHPHSVSFIGLQRDVPNASGDELIVTLLAELHISNPWTQIHQ